MERRKKLTRVRLEALIAVESRPEVHVSIDSGKPRIACLLERDAVLCDALVS